MDDQTITQIVDELRVLVGRAPGKIFQVKDLTFVIDFRLRDGYLLVSAEPSMPRMHLIKRRVRDLEKSSKHLNQFGWALKAALSNAKLAAIEKDEDDRIVYFRFVEEIESGSRRAELVAQLTGRSANLFLLNE